MCSLRVLMMILNNLKGREYLGKVILSVFRGSLSRDLGDLMAILFGCWFSANKSVTKFKQNKISPHFNLHKNNPETKSIVPDPLQTERFQFPRVNGQLAHSQHHTSGIQHPSLPPSIDE